MGFLLPSSFFLLPSSFFLLSYFFFLLSSCFFRLSSFFFLLSSLFVLLSSFFFLLSSFFCFCAFICLCLSFCSPSLGREVPPGWGNCKFSSYVSVSVLFSVNICPSVLSAWAGKYRQVGRTVGNNITYCSPLSGGAISWCQCGHRKSF